MHQRWLHPVQRFERGRRYHPFTELLVPSALHLVGLTMGDSQIPFPRDDPGEFSTQNWTINGYYGFWDTLLDLYACKCPASSGTTEAPTSIWVVAEASRIFPTGSHPWYHYNVAGGAHSVILGAVRFEPDLIHRAESLIDPDGFVFDSHPGNRTKSTPVHMLWLGARLRPMSGYRNGVVGYSGRRSSTMIRSILR